MKGQETVAQLAARYEVSLIRDIRPGNCNLFKVIRPVMLLSSDYVPFMTGGPPYR